MKSTVDLVLLRTVIAVAQTRSFTRAAERVGADRSLISRRIRAFETWLGVPVFARTTRSVRLTPEGDQLVRRLAPALASLDDALGDVPSRLDVPSGVVSITATPDLGRSLLAPALVSFRARYPTLRVTVTLADDVINLVDSDIDLALRVGKPGGATLSARKLGTLAAAFYAAPGYLERRGSPLRLDQLRDHERLWPPVRGKQRAFTAGTSPPAADIACADFTMLAELARLGGGVAVLPTIVGERHAAVGALVRVLPDITMGGAPLYLVSRHVRPIPPRVKTLRDHLIPIIRAAL